MFRDKDEALQARKQLLEDGARKDPEGRLHLLDAYMRELCSLPWTELLLLLADLGLKVPPTSGQVRLLCRVREGIETLMFPLGRPSERPTGNNPRTKKDEHGS